MIQRQKAKCNQTAVLVLVRILPLTANGSLPNKLKTVRPTSPQHHFQSIFCENISPLRTCPIS